MPCLPFYAQKSLDNKLYQAVRSGDYKKIQDAIAQGGNVNSIHKSTSYDIRLPLIRIAVRELPINVATLELLLLENASITKPYEMKFPIEVNGRKVGVRIKQVGSILHDALDSYSINLIEILTVLINHGANVNAVNGIGESVFAYTCSRNRAGRYAALNLLLNARTPAKVDVAADKIFTGCGENSPKDLELLFDKLVELNIPDLFSTKVLNALSCGKGWVSVVLKYRDKFFVEDIKYTKFLTKIILNNQAISFVQEALKQGIELIPEHGDNLIHYFTRIKTYTEDDRKFVEDFAKENLDICNVENEYGVTPINLLITNMYNDPDKHPLFKLLVKIDPEQPITYQRSTTVDGVTSKQYITTTILKFAIFFMQPCTVKTLLDLNVSINSADVNGYTPVMHAIKRKDLTIVKLLVENGANLHAVANDGKTIAELVFEAESENISTGIFGATDKTQTAIRDYITLAVALRSGPNLASKLAARTALRM